MKNFTIVCMQTGSRHFTATAMLNGKQIVGTAKCSPEDFDHFDEDFGRQLAILRCKEKVLKAIANENDMVRKAAAERKAACEKALASANHDDVVWFNRTMEAIEELVATRNALSELATSLM